MADPTLTDLAEAIDETARVLDALRSTADDLVVEMMAARAATDRARTEGRRTRLLAGIGAGVSVLVLVVALSAAALQRQSDLETEGRRQQTETVLEALAACTNPGHPCYDENQARSSERLAPIVSLICDAVPDDRRRPPCPPR